MSDKTKYLPKDLGEEKCAWPGDEKMSFVTKKQKNKCFSSFSLCKSCTGITFKSVLFKHNFCL